MSSKHQSQRYSGGRDRDRDGDSSRGDKRPRHDPRHGRDGSRDGRDRDPPRGGSWRDGDSRPASTGATNTPPKPQAPGRGGVLGPGGRPGGPVLGGSVFSSAILEAAKRRAQEQAAAAAQEAEPGELEAPAKKPKHEPIVWHSPRRQDASQGGGRPPAQQESLQERLAREAAEFREQQQLGGAGGKQGGQRPQSGGGGRPAPPRSASSDSGGSPAGRQGRARGGSRSRSRSQSRSSSSDRAGARPAGGRWQLEEEEEDGGAAADRRPAHSRWAVDADGGGGGGGPADGAVEVEEGEAPPDEAGGVGAALDEELDELNRRERAELEAALAAAGGYDSGGEEAASDLSGGDGTAAAGGPLHKNMLEESRRVEEYERLNRISEGTYGVVHRARCKATGRILALKKLKLETCPDGFPQTSVREMNVLLSLHHPNIVNVAEVVVGSRDAVYMAMEFVEHDLKHVLELQHAKKAPPFSIGQIKCLMHQLLEGVHYLHDHWVIHRDLKTSNLLYSNSGQLKICDFGLARQYGSPLRPFTPAVVTLWYRSIERLLGDPLYSTALDMWSVGCIMAELVLGEPLFQGRGELDQIKKIFQLMGTPTQESWPGWDQLPDAKALTWKPQECRLRSKFPAMLLGSSQPILNDTGFDLLCQLLEMNPRRRITALDALQHPWFSEAPRAVNAALMPSFPARHAGGG